MNWSPQLQRCRRYRIYLQLIWQEESSGKNIHGHSSSAETIDIIDVLDQVQAQTRRTNIVLQQTQWSHVDSRNIRGKVKPLLRMTSKSSSSQHYNRNTGKSKCLKKSLHRFLLPRSNHSVLLECLNSTWLRDAEVTGSAYIALHSDPIWKTVHYTPDSTHTISGSERRWYRTMTRYVSITNKEVAAVREKDLWWRGKQSFELKYQS